MNECIWNLRCVLNHLSVITTHNCTMSQTYEHFVYMSYAVIIPKIINAVEEIKNNINNSGVFVSLFNE